MPEPTRNNITGVILAGGKARRMGGQDKGLISFGGRPLVAWVVAALRTQVGTLLINANRNTETYAALGYPVITDRTPDFQGPLAGIASAMAMVETPWILTLPCDGPFPPTDLAHRLAMTLTQANAEVAIARDAERLHPTHALLSVALAPSLQRYLAAGERRLDTWQAQHRRALANFSDCPLAFANINSPQDVPLLEAQIRS